MNLKRKVKRGKAKDYRRNAKYFDYYYIVYKNKTYTLNLNGWNYEENIQVIDDKVEIEGNRIELIW